MLQVQGAYDVAREECRLLQNLTEELVWTTCLANVNGATGRLRESYEQLRSVFQKTPGGPPTMQSWVLTSLAEMAARAGMVTEAGAHFRAALASDAADYYLLAAYADFLLDSDRAEDVAALLQEKTAADPMMLRYTLALQALHSKELPVRIEQLQDRFTAADLMRLLYGGYPVEAYCDFCDEFWTVSIQKRVELGEIVAAVCAHVPPSAGPELKINH